MVNERIDSTMEIKEFENLKKDIEIYNNRVIKVSANKEIITKEIRNILNHYGISDIKDYKKLIEMRDTMEPEIKKYLEEKSKELSENQAKLSELESILVNGD